MSFAAAANSWVGTVRSAPRRVLRTRIERSLSDADIWLDGGRPWDPQIHDERVFARIAAQGSLGVGESYVEGWWDCEQLDELAHRVLRAGADVRLLRSPGDWLRLARACLWNLQSIGRAAHVARRHYDLGNDLFRAMLDSRAIYSCGYWRDAHTLDEAQEAKLDLVARKLALERGMRVLDVGCGWGGAARFLPISIEHTDYRAIEGHYDRAYSLGMFEHVGWQNHRACLAAVCDHLEPDGLFLLHTIGALVSARCGDSWVGRYIFPNSVLPSAAQIAAASEGLFVLEDWHNFGSHYDATLLAWHGNLERAWPRLAPRYGERFRRMWRYYLLTSAGGFRARTQQLWQIVLSPRGVVGGYRSVR